MQCGISRGYKRFQAVTYRGWEEPEEHVAIVRLVNSEETRITG